MGCAASCGTCGGPGCAEREGDCCTGDVEGGGPCGDHSDHTCTIPGTSPNPCVDGEGEAVCLNGATCTRIAGTIADTHTCTCAAGFYGDTCAHHIRGQESVVDSVRKGLRA